MKKEIRIFTNEVFGEIRTCQVNNQIMFVGKDVATALGYSNTRDALSKHVDAEDKGTVAIRDTAHAQGDRNLVHTGSQRLPFSSLGKRLLYHSRVCLFCATDFEGIGLICRLWGRLSLQVREKIGKYLGN